MKRQPQPAPLVKAHSNQHAATLSKGSVDLLRDPRALRLLVELGYHWISTTDRPRQLIPHRFYIDTFRSKTAEGVFWHASAHTCTCRGFAGSGECRHVREMKRREAKRGGSEHGDRSSVDRFARALADEFQPGAGRTS